MNQRQGKQFRGGEAKITATQAELARQSTNIIFQTSQFPDASHTLIKPSKSTKQTTPLLFLQNTDAGNREKQTHQWKNTRKQHTNNCITNRPTARKQNATASKFQNVEKCCPPIKCRVFYF